MLKWINNVAVAEDGDTYVMYEILDRVSTEDVSKPNPPMFP